jgi:23S rRNA pseudouridine2605 synthase
MPRDTDKDNDSRGRRDRPQRARSDGGKGRSGAARGPEKKFAKRGFGGKDAADKRDGDKPRFNRDERPRGDRPFADRPARAGDGEKRAFKPRGDRPKFGDGDKRPYTPREGGGEKRPYTSRANRDDARPAARSSERKFGERKPYTPREGGGDKRPYTPRSNRDEGSSERKFGERKPYTPREGGGEKRPYTPRANRDEGSSERKFGERKPYTPREGGGDKRPYTPREGGGEKRPYAPRTGDRPERKFGGDKKFSRGAPDRGPPRDRAPRKDFGDRPSGGDSKPWQKRGPGSDRPERSSRPAGEGARNFDRPKFDRPREDRADRPKFDRPKFDRPRERSEERPGEGFADRPRRRNEDDSKVFAKRPAFGGRGAYRDRKPETDKRSARAVAEAPKSTKAGERIAKVVSRAGLASRRDAEEWIVQGRVTVNGRVINSPALDVTANDVIEVDGKPLPERERTRLFLYHKPRGLMTTHADPEGRPTVFDNLPEHLPRVISIGRLDFNTEGLLLLTNDGGLARALELPETGWLRRYRVRAHGEVTQAQLDQLTAGIEVDGVKYGPIEASLERDQGANVWLVVAIREGKNREVRNVLAHLGLEVNRLIRVSYGPFQLGEIAEGEVQEIKTRVLREQLGEKLIAQAGADFGPVPEKTGDREPLPAAKPKPKREVVADRKGRRVLVERTGSDEARARNEDEASGYGPPKRPKRGYHGKRDLKPLEE